MGHNKYSDDTVASRFRVGVVTSDAERGRDVQKQVEQALSVYLDTGEEPNREALNKIVHPFLDSVVTDIRIDIAQAVGNDEIEKLLATSDDELSEAFSEKTTTADTNGNITVSRKEYGDGIVMEVVDGDPAAVLRHLSKSDKKPPAEVLNTIAAGVLKDGPEPVVTTSDYVAIGGRTREEMDENTRRALRRLGLPDERIEKLIAEGQTVYRGDPDVDPGIVAEIEKWSGKPWVREPDAGGTASADDLSSPDPLRREALQIAMKRCGIETTTDELLAEAQRIYDFLKAG